VPEADLKSQKAGKRKLNRRKKAICWILVDLAVAATVLALLLYKPAHYRVIRPGGAGYEQGQVHPYVSHELLPDFYNGAQRGEPFELGVVEDKINEAIAGWSEESESVSLSAPSVVFLPGRVVLMATANIRGAKLVVSAVLEPKIDEQGLLNLGVAKLKVGAMNITFLAKMMAKRMYQHQLATVRVDTEDTRTKIAASLLNSEPFEPIFKGEDKKVRLEEITITKGKLTLRFVPAQ
jgi:uncharacterized protein YpmS